MRSMRSMRGGLFPAVKGPCKRYAMAPARMLGHNCLYAFYAFYALGVLSPGAADDMFPGGKPHEQNKRFHGKMAV
jgi:hypothetical protein